MAQKVKSMKYNIMLMIGSVDVDEILKYGTLVEY